MHFAHAERRDSFWSLSIFWLQCQDFLICLFRNNLEKRGFLSIWRTFVSVQSVIVAPCSHITLILLCIGVVEVLQCVRY